MEIKLYTKKEANEIIKKYPNRHLQTKTVVVDIIENEADENIYTKYHEKRMFYIVEHIYKPGVMLIKIFQENKEQD